MSSCALVLIVGAAHGEPQRSKARPTYSIVGDWVRVGGKPRAVTRYRADGKWSMHVIGVRGFTADMTGTYTLRGNVLKRKSMKTVLSEKRPYEREIPPAYETPYQLKWLTRDTIVLTDTRGSPTRKRFPDSWARLHARSSN